MNEYLDRLDEAMLDLAWSLWSALGVSSWSAREVPYVVEVEPLLAFTAFVGRSDERLRREVTSWVATQMPLLSVRQFRHVVTAQRWPFEGPVNDLGALLSAATGRRWPGGTDDPPSLSLSDRPSTVDLHAPWSLQLRSRSLFGVSARAEIFRVLLLCDHPLSVSELAQRVAYTRRQVGADVELLTSAGFLERSSSPGPTRVSLERQEAVHDLLGPAGDDFDWAPTFRLLTGLRQLVHDLTTRSWSEPSIEVARQLRALEPQLHRVRWEVAIPRGPDQPGEVTEAAMRILDGIPVVR